MSAITTNLQRILFRDSHQSRRGHTFHEVNNKMKKETWFAFVVVCLILIFVMVFSLLLINLSDGIKREEEECKELTGDLGLKFTHYNSGGYSHSECWAFNETSNEAVRLW